MRSEPELSPDARPKQIAFTVECFLCNSLKFERVLFICMKKNGTLAGAALKGRNGMKKPVYRYISAGGKEVTG